MAAYAGKWAKLDDISSQIGMITSSAGATSVSHKVNNYWCH